MSVEYYFVCDDCKTYCWIASDGLSGPQLQVWGHKAQAGFIIDHKECHGFRVVDEHEMDSDYWDEHCDEYVDIQGVH